MTCHSTYIAIVALPPSQLARELRDAVEDVQGLEHVPRLLHITLLYAPLALGLKPVDILQKLDKKDVLKQPFQSCTIYKPYTSHYNTVCLGIKEQQAFKQCHLALSDILSHCLHQEFMTALSAKKVGYTNLLKTSNIGASYHAHMTLATQFYAKDTTVLKTQLAKFNKLSFQPDYCLCDATDTLTPLHFFN